MFYKHLVELQRTQKLHTKTRTNSSLFLFVAAKGVSWEAATIEERVFGEEREGSNGK